MEIRFGNPSVLDVIFFQFVLKLNQFVFFLFRNRKCNKQSHFYINFTFQTLAFFQINDS